MKQSTDTIATTFKLALQAMEHAVRTNDGTALWEAMHGYVERKTRRELLKRMGFAVRVGNGAHYEEAHTVTRDVYEQKGWKTKRTVDEYGNDVVRRVPRWVPTGKTEEVALVWEASDEWADVQQGIAIMMLEMKPISRREKGKPARLVPLASIIDEANDAGQDGALRCYWALVNRAFEIAVNVYGLDVERFHPMVDGYGASTASAETELLREIADANAALDLEIAERRADAPRTQAAGLVVLHGLHGAERDYLAEALMGLQADPAARKARQRMVARLQVEAQAGLITEETFEAALRTMKTWIHALA